MIHEQYLRGPEHCQDSVLAPGSVEDFDDSAGLIAAVFAQETTLTNFGSQLAQVVTVLAYAG